MKTTLFNTLLLCGVLCLLAGCDTERKRAEAASQAEQAAKTEASAYLSENHDFSLSVVNGQTLVRSFVAAQSCTNKEFSALFSDAVFELADHNLTIAGSVAGKPESRLGATIGKKILDAIPLNAVTNISQAIDTSKLKVTVGDSSQQPLNVSVDLRDSFRDEVLKLESGQPVVFRGRLSGSKMAFYDAVLVETNDYEQALAMLDNQYVRSAVSGESVVIAEPFESVSGPARLELLKMAKCAELAYPDMALPEGYTPFLPEEWDSISSASHIDWNRYNTRTGYLVLGDDLRGRLLHGPSGLTVISWSGCDLDKYESLEHGIVDFATCVKYIALGEKENQFKLVPKVCNAVLRSIKGNVWIVGHSLGGALTAYSALNIPDEYYGRVRCATFNGLGISCLDFSNTAYEKRAQAASCIVNVYCTTDPVFNLHRHFRKFAGALASYFAPRHLGRSYFLEYDASAKGDPEQFEQWKNAVMDEVLDWLAGLLPEQYQLFVKVLPLDRVKTGIKSVAGSVLDIGNEIVTSHDIGTMIDQMQLRCTVNVEDSSVKFPVWVSASIFSFASVAILVFVIFMLKHKNRETV